MKSKKIKIYENIFISNIFIHKSIISKGGGCAAAIGADARTARKAASSGYNCQLDKEPRIASQDLKFSGERF